MKKFMLIGTSVLVFAAQSFAVENDNEDKGNVNQSKPVSQDVNSNNSDEGFPLWRELPVELQLGVLENLNNNQIRKFATAAQHESNLSKYVIQSRWVEAMVKLFPGYIETFEDGSVKKSLELELSSGNLVMYLNMMAKYVQILDTTCATLSIVPEKASEQSNAVFGYLFGSRNPMFPFAIGTYENQVRAINEFGELEKYFSGCMTGGMSVLLPASITALKDLKTIDPMTLSQLIALPNNFTDLKNLRELNLTLSAQIDNQGYRLQYLRELPYAFAFEFLEKLTIQNYRLSALPESMADGFPNIESITISGTDITELPEGMFTNNPRLKHLDLSGNRLTKLTGAWNLPSLKHLDVSKNRISCVTGWKLNADALKFASFEENDLTELPDFSGVRSNTDSTSKKLALLPYKMHLNNNFLTLDGRKVQDTLDSLKNKGFYLSSYSEQKENPNPNKN